MPPWPPAKPGLDAGKWSWEDPRRLEPATWFPARPRAGARLSLKESRRKEHQGGERFSPPWTRLSLVCDQREVFSICRDWPAAHLSHARYGPPTGWAGWEGWFRRREGAILYPTFPCRSRKRGLPAVAPTEIFLLLRWASRSPPHPSPSVTASPQGEAFGLCYPTRKKRPKSGYADGHRNSPPTGTLRPTTPKPASGNERAIKKGVQGARPPALFLPISREKWGPRRAGGPPGRCAPRHRKSPDHP